MIKKGGNMMGWVKDHEKHLQCIWLCGLFIVFGITRMWQLNTLPYGIYVDEAGMAYDAWCLANWGVDRHLSSWPVYLINFSGGQSSLYAFICAALFKVFGESLFIIRFPATIFSFLTLIFGMKLVKRVYPNSVYPMLLAGTLIVISPFFVMGSRIGLDCNLMLGMSTLFLYFFMTAIETGKLWRYFAAGVAGGVLLYTYVLSYIVLPVFLFLVLVYTIWVKKFSITNWVLMAIPMGILAFPLILVQIINYFDFPQMQLGIFTITKLPVYRISEIGEFTWSNVSDALRCIFVGDELVFDSIPRIWNLYIVTAVLFIAGLISACVKILNCGLKRTYCALLFPVCWFFVIFIQACFMSVYTYRVNGIFFVTVFLAVEGLWSVRKYLGHFWKPVSMVICVVYVLCFLRFGRFYFGGEYVENTKMKTDNFGVLITEGIEFIESDPILNQKLTYVWENPIYYAASVYPSPYEFDILGDKPGIWGQYWFGALGLIEEQCNYMVPAGQFEAYCEELVQAGFTEKEFGDYSVYYKK